MIVPRIIDCGYFSKPELHKETPLRVVKFFEIEVCTDDGGETFIDGREIKIEKNRVFVAKPNCVRHTFLPLKTIFLRLECEGEFEKILNSIPDTFFAAHIDAIVEILSDIILLTEEKVRNEVLIGSKLLALIDYLLRDSQLDCKEYHTMHKAKKYIEENFDKKILSSDVADYVSLSESHFRLLFRDTYGISPHQYLLNVRVAHAKQMLWENAFSMSEIAEKCGFGCQQYFNEIFKKQTGFSPKKYKDDFERRYHND